MKKYVLMTTILLATRISVILAQGNNDYLQGIELVDRKDYKEEKDGSKINNPDSVSVLTKNQFAKDYPNSTDVYFRKTINYCQISFKTDNKKMRAYYDFNNELIGSSWRVSFKELPENAQEYIKNNYKGYDILRVFLFDLNPHNNSYPTNEYQYMTLFGNRFEKASNYFVELKNDKTELTLRVTLAGEVSFFHSVKLLGFSDK